MVLTHTITVARIIAAPTPRLYDFVLDMRNDTRWAPLVEGVRQIKGDGPGQGAAYEIQQRFGKRVHPTIIAVEETVRPASITWTMPTRFFDYRSTMVFAPHPRGTQVRQRTEYHWKPEAPWQVRWGLRLVARRGLKRQLRLLERCMRQRA